ncbi:HNH endonuclease [Streptomyces sp. NPDC055006]
MYYQTNRARQLTYNAEWQRNNPDRCAERDQRRRSRKACTLHEPYDRADIFARWEGLCCYCDEPAEALDHVTPVALGGADAAWNLVPACKPCNSSKGAKTLAEWALAWHSAP